MPIFLFRRIMTVGMENLFWRRLNCMNWLMQGLIIRYSVIYWSVVIVLSTELPLRLYSIRYQWSKKEDPSMERVPILRISGLVF